MHDKVVPDQLHDNLLHVRARIADAALAAGRSATDVTIIAAVKYVDAETARLLVQAGITDLADNRLDALEERRAALADLTDVRWHYIGRLQSRKTSAVVHAADVVHSVASASAISRLPAADELARERGGFVPKLLVQVNTADDPDKDGIAPGDLDALLERVPEGWHVAGLSTMPWGAGDNPETNRAAFAALRTLAADAQTRWNGRHSLRELSMGTTQDYLVAIEEGATMVRLGRILFPVREPIPE